MLAASAAATSAASATSSKFLPVTRQTAALIDGQRTEVVIMSFHDRVLVVVTQLGKIGTVIEAHADPTIDRKPSFTINTLIGKRDQPILMLCARQIVQEISKLSRNLFCCQ